MVLVQTLIYPLSIKLYSFGALSSRPGAFLSDEELEARAIGFGSVKLVEASPFLSQAFCEW